MRRNSLIRVAIAFACLPAFAALAHGADDVRYELQIERQSLSSALQEFARQSGVQIVFFSKITDGYEAPSLSGTFSAAAALGRLLDGSQLTFRELNPKTIEVTPKAAVNDLKIGSPAATPKSLDNGFGGSSASIAAAGTTRHAQADAPGGSGSSGENSPSVAANEPAAASATPSQAIPEMLVLGSRILNADIRRAEDDAQPYMIFEHEDIESSGARNVEDFLARRLTASTSSTMASQDGGQFLGNTSSIDLRGLGKDETLILIDGRRVAGFSQIGVPRQADINGIPLAAIERIEVLPTTASGIYGGGATGGVINIVLRRDYAGVDAKLTYQGTFDGGGARKQIDLTAGVPLEDDRTSIMFTASYAEADELLITDRDLRQRGIDRLLANAPTAVFGPSPPLGATTNISTIGINRPNLTLDNGTPLGSPITFVPPGYAGPASDNGAGLIANAGRYNLDFADSANSGRRGLVNAPTVKTFTATVRREFTSWLDAYLDVSTSDNDGSFARGADSVFLIPGNAPGNPFQQTVRVTTPIYGTDSAVESLLESDRAAAGVIIDLPARWRAQADYTRNRVRLSYFQPPFDLDSQRAAADMGSGLLNVFRDTNVNPIDFSSYLGNSVRSDAKTTLENPALRLSGPLPLSLPGGPPTLSLLLEYRKEKIADQITPSAPPASFPPIDVLIPSRWQSVRSAYMELRLPFVVEGNAVPGVELLELQVAGRWDDYKTVGSSLLIPLVNGAPLVPVERETNEFDSGNPTFGVRYKPVSDVMLRASYGTGFLPPNVSQLVSNPSSFLPPPPFSGLTDPRRGGEPLGLSGLVTSRTGGNPELDPEESESWSAGLVLTPRFLPGLRLSADWTRIEKTDNIGILLATQANLTIEQIVPGFVTRSTDPATFGAFAVGPIVAVDQRLRNIALTKVEAYDFAADYRWATDRFGQFRASAAATRFAHNEAQAVPEAPIVESAGTIAGVKLRGNASLDWSYGNWSAAWTARYFDSYRLFAVGFDNPIVSAAQGSTTVPSQTYHDLFVGYRFGAPTRGSLFAGSEIQLGVNNLFDQEPPVDLTNGAAFYSTLGDPRLASYYISLRKAF